MSPPTILRIKRKRGQDPLQALILEDQRSVKRSKVSTPVGSPKGSPKASPKLAPSPSPHIPPVNPAEKIYFRLKRTDEVRIREENDVIQSILTPDEKPLDPEARQFVIPNRSTVEDTVIPNELSDMLETYLSVDGVETKTDDYVYDVYYLDSEPLTTANHPQSQIGYIKFFEEDEDNEVLKVYELDKEDTQLSDDEDSNAEDFYQNDYPSDDGQEWSDEFGDDSNEEYGYGEDEYEYD